MRVKGLLFAKRRDDVVDHSMMLNEVSQMMKSRKCGERVGTTQSVVYVPKGVASISPQAKGLKEICRPFDDSIRIFRASCQASGI